MPRRLGEILDRALTIAARNWRFVALCIVPTIVLSIAVNSGFIALLRNSIPTFGAPYIVLPLIESTIVITTAWRERFIGMRETLLGSSRAIATA
jgi:hypothetical protein